MLEDVGPRRAEAVARPTPRARRGGWREKVRESLAQAALLQVSAVGLGTIVAALASTTAADVTGSWRRERSLIGLFLLPARREKMRAAKRSAKVKHAARAADAPRSGRASMPSARTGGGAHPRCGGAHAAFVGREQQRLTQRARRSPRSQRVSRTSLRGWEASR